MGTTGAFIMSFFGAVFAALTLHLGFGWQGAGLALPFAVFAAIALWAWRVTRRAGPALELPQGAGRVILWSSTAEGIGLFLAANIVSNLGRPDLLLPAMALVVGLHFLPMAWAIPARAYYAPAVALIAAAVAGGLAGPPNGTRIAGSAAALALWLASAAAVRREAVAKRGSAATAQQQAGDGVVASL